MIDFDSLLQNPIDYIQDLAQTSEVKPDFGIRNFLLQISEQRPDLINKITLIANNKDMEQQPPGSLVRVRCYGLFYHAKSIIPLKIRYGDRYYTPLVSMNLPDDNYIPNAEPSMCIENDIYVVTSLPNYVSIDHSNNYQELPLHLSFGNDSTTQQNISSVPFQILARLPQDDELRPLQPVDLIGVIEEPEPLSDELFSSEDHPSLTTTFIDALPHLDVLCVLPVQSLYNLPTEIFSKLPAPHILRSNLLSFLSTFLSPPQAEILLLWLMGKRIETEGNYVLGLFSLNFFGLKSDTAIFISNILSNLCTSVAYEKLTLESISCKSLRPTLKDGIFNTSILSSVNGTRIIFDETDFELSQEGFNLNQVKLNDNCKENLSILGETLSTHSVDFNYDGGSQHQSLASPILLLSNSPSTIARLDVTIPIGDFNTSQEVNLSPSDFAAIKYYVENARFSEVQPFDEEINSLIIQTMTKLRAELKVSQINLHLFMTLCELKAVSEASCLTQKSITEVETLFRWILENTITK